ncbi:type III pantothenate kinase [Thalassotalea euphylliae]|nr:type III pantothenate kinase [Thalassotalea euphylliae]
MLGNKQLLIDIGNTRTKYCFVVDDKLASIQYCDNQSLSTTWFNQHWLGCDQLVLASVAHQNIEELIKHWALAQKIRCQQVKTPDKAFGVTNGYERYEQLGVDRWLAVLGASKRFANQACIVVDTGTATTIDYIDSNGCHQGGWILAGIETLFNSIQANTANVRGDRIQINSLGFGRNTNDNLAQAAWASTVGLIKQAMLTAEQLNDVTPLLVITGGNGERIAQMLDIDSTRVHYVPAIVFEGLACYLA